MKFIPAGEALPFLLIIYINRLWGGFFLAKNRGE